jgi:hypothetical protein
LWQAPGAARRLRATAARGSDICQQAAAEFRSSAVPALDRRVDPVNRFPVRALSATADQLMSLDFWRAAATFQCGHPLCVATQSPHDRSWPRRASAGQNLLAVIRTFNLDGWCLPSRNGVATLNGGLWPVVCVRDGARKLPFAARAPLSNGGYPRPWELRLSAISCRIGTAALRLDRRSARIRSQGQLALLQYFRWADRDQGCSKRLPACSIPPAAA